MITLHFQRAFELLRSENYTNFILTVRCIAVAIYCNGNMGFKIFDSHARDLYGRGQPQGTCVLLEVTSLNSLVHYFQSIHNNDIFEVRRVQIENIQNRMVSQYSVNETTNFNLSCAVALYSLCYSVIKPCNYWNYNSSLPTIVNNGKNMFRKSSLEHNQLLPANLPRTIEVFGTEVNLENFFDTEGVLTDSFQSKLILENDIINTCNTTRVSPQQKARVNANMRLVFLSFVWLMVIK